MRKGVLLYLSMYMLQLFSGNEVQDLRSMYYKSIEDEQSAKKFFKYFDNKDVKNNVILTGYCAVANFLQSKHAWNPYVKLEYYNVGKAQLEHAIELDLENIELRFLRLSIQNNLPSFLDYSKSIKEDTNFLINHLTEIKDYDLKQKITLYLQELKAL